MSFRFPKNSEKPVFFLASSNQGKLAELKDLLGESSHLVTLADMPDLTEGEEVGSTFQQNAHIKSLTISRQLLAKNIKGVLVLSDDSGIQVDALVGRPGVVSARYFQMTQEWDTRTAKEQKITPQERHQRNNARLLADLKGVPVGERGAQFQTVLSLVRDGKVLITVAAISRGEIAMATRGEDGFSYDLLFAPVGQKGKKKTYGEMTMAEKHRFSMRAKALDELMKTMRHYRLIPSHTHLHVGGQPSLDFSRSGLKTAVWVAESLQGRNEEGQLPVVRSPDRFSRMKLPISRPGAASPPESACSQPIHGK